MINRLSGGDMWVAEDRVAEYLAAGHKLPAAPPAEEPAAAPEKPKTRRKKAAE